MINFDDARKAKAKHNFLSRTLTFSVCTSVAALPQNWDAVAADNIFLSEDYLKVLELSAPENMSCYFIAVFDGNNLAGIGVSQFLDLSDVDSFGVRDNCFKTHLRNFVFRRFASHVLIFGNNMLTGQNTFRLATGTDEKQAFAAFDDALKQITATLRKKGKKTHLTIWKDFPLGRHGEIPEISQYYKFSTQPNMILQLRSHWKSEQDYVADFNKKYRDQYKRARKKNEGVEKRKLTLEEIKANNEKIYELYFTVARSASFNTFWLARNHFIALKESLRDNFLFYGYFLDGELVGFDTLIKNGESMDTYFLGYDENCQREKMLYLNMLYNMIAYSIKKRFINVIFARTALEIKSSVGARPVYLSGYIRHSNKLINLLMPKLFSYFEPEMDWKERHPFKDSEQPAAFAGAAS